MFQKIFISATTNGLRDYRRIAAEIVAAQGFTPVVQETFSTPSDEMTRKIESEVFDCSGIIAIVGPYYGQRSTIVEDAPMALSYSQYELKYALHFRRPALALIATPDCDLDESDPEPEDLLRCQAEFVEWLTANTDRRFGWTRFCDRFRFAEALAKHRWREWLGG